jgi:lambda repressor-like predicted transcriptional regulator
LTSSSDRTSRLWQAGLVSQAAYVLARTARGASLAAISLEAGLHKDWLSRHLAEVDPAAAVAARRLNDARADARWLPLLSELGFADVPGYLRDRHLVQFQTVHAIAAELGFSHHSVTAALRRHGLAYIRHAAKRHVASQRADQVAAALGHASIADYIAQRRTQGWSWKAMSAESGQPQSWLRRHSAGSRSGSGTASGHRSG